MNVTYYPYTPIHITPGRIVVVDTAIPKVYSDLTDGFRKELDTIRLSDDEFQSLDIAKWSQWYGDPRLELNLDRQFQRVVLKRYLNVMSATEQSTLMDLARQLSGRVLENSFALDLPLDVTTLASVEAIIKFSGLHYSESASTDGYVTLETLIKTITELNDPQLTVLTNVSHYLEKSQLQDLVKLVGTTAIPMLVIEFSECERRENFENCDYIWIDHDFVDSRELE